MYPFEVWHPEKKCIHFHHDKFWSYVTNRFFQYPVTLQHRRYAIDICFPSNCLDQVPCHWDPGQGSHNLDYMEENDFSVIFEPFPLHMPHTEAYKIFIEDGHDKPWGERVHLASTAASLLDDHSNRFCQFRNKYWKVTSITVYQPFTLWEVIDGEINVPAIRAVNSSIRIIKPRIYLSLANYIDNKYDEPCSITIPKQIIKAINNNGCRYKGINISYDDPSTTFLGRMWRDITDDLP